MDHPPGSASVIESTFPAEGPYVGLTHKLNDVVKGGAFLVVGSNNSNMNDIPTEATVPKPGMGQSMNMTETSAISSNATSNTTSNNQTSSAGNQTSKNAASSGNQTGMNSTGG